MMDHDTPRTVVASQNNAVHVCGKSTSIGLMASYHARVESRARNMTELYFWLRILATTRGVCSHHGMLLRWTAETALVVAIDHCYVVLEG